jgi:DHA1 family bicyclomycin/chloramphenicol resistance-like MFS transporter
LLAAMTALTALSIDMNLPSLPHFARIFRSDAATAQLTLSLFLVGYGVGQLVCGPVADRYGRRPVLIAGLSVFTVAGFLCALAPSLPALVALRALQGLGASVGPILARAIVRDRYEGKEAIGVLSQITQVMILAPMIAPTLGGILLGSLGWSSIFVLLGLFGAALFVLVWRRLPETIPARHTEPDYVRHISRSFGEVLAHPGTRRHLLNICLASAGMFAYISGSPFVVMEVFGVSRQAFGILFALPALSLLGGATVNRYLLTRMGSPEILRLGGRIVAAAGVAIAACALAGVGGVAGVIVPMMGYLFGVGLLMPNATSAAMAPFAKTAGLTSSLIGALQTAAGALSGLLVGTLYDHTSRPLALTVGTLAVLSLLCASRERVSVPQPAVAME